MMPAISPLENDVRFIARDIAGILRRMDSLIESMEKLRELIAAALSQEEKS